MPKLPALLFAAAVLAAPLQAVADDRHPEPATLTLSADGIAHAAPDTAIVTSGVVTEAPTAGAALTDNNAAMRRLIDEVKAAGIADKDVATSGFSIEPVMVYPPQKEDGSQDPPRVTGYRVTNQVTVKIREIGKAGDLLDKVVRVGANQVQGVTFTIENPESLLDAARGDAMRTALARADVYAKAGAFEIGRILSVSEGGGYSPSPAPYARKMTMEAAPADSVPVAVGEQAMQVSVTVTWEIRQKP